MMNTNVGYLKIASCFMHLVPFDLSFKLTLTMVFLFFLKHAAVTDLDASTSFFGVYDGHGGKFFYFCPCYFAY